MAELKRFIDKLELHKEVPEEYKKKNYIPIGLKIKKNIKLVFCLSFWLGIMFLGIAFYLNTIFFTGCMVASIGLFIIATITGIEYGKILLSEKDEDK